MEDKKTFEEVLNELREADPFRHDLLVAFHEYARGVEIQKRAVGQLLDMLGAVKDRLEVVEGGKADG